MVGFKPPDAPPTTTVKFFGAGTAACFADILTFPLDTAKVRLQIQGEPGAGQPVRYRGVLGTILTMARTEGPGSLYGGLVAGLQRQMSFASVRIGLYDSVKQLYTPAGSEQSSIAVRLLAGCTTGAMAVTCAQPTDVVKVRFQACVQLEPGSRKYSGTVDAYRTIAREEGVRGLWKGTVPNITRNAIVNCAEMVTYDLIKESLTDHHLMTGEASWRLAPRHQGEMVCKKVALTFKHKGQLHTGCVVQRAHTRTHRVKPFDEGTSQRTDFLRSWHLLRTMIQKENSQRARRPCGRAVLKPRPFFHCLDGQGGLYHLLRLKFQFNSQLSLVYCPPSLPQK
ncbi:mitochondrial uncoupling protein 3 isoform X1 [Ornithorhynchus anatinus]|uniref:mitochondrial uncoupling protein 3 isoform X1 n=1 Tax=Ornithorhynchus anatinus TaxID=9258 RepID=UPI0010A7A367|nr:mitochondrial uncoupling protein 3 isoform X1 [Ornithorhynchus anatinus]